MLDSVEVSLNALEPPCERLVGEEVDLLFRKIDRRLNVGSQLDERVGEAPDHRRELPLQGSHRSTSRLSRAGVDQVGDRLGLSQIELVVEKRTLCELARVGASRPELDDSRYQSLEHHLAPVTVQFQHVLAGVRVRCREEKRQTGIDRLVVRIREAGERRATRYRDLTKHDSSDFGRLDTGDPHDADPASTRRGCGSHDRVGVSHSQ